MSIYIALLRGINVGGKNKIKMADLREALTSIGLRDVQTYIQSGNILFKSEEDEAALRSRIEQQIETVFGLRIKVVMRTAEEMRAIAASCPFTEEQLAAAAASAQGESLYVSMMLEEPSAEQLENLRIFETEEEIFGSKGRDLYFLFYQTVRNSKLAVKAEKLGVHSTVRNWNTINKLVSLSDGMQ
ncbi:Uncharacterized conserved protein, DUF1697 family [Paenibacillus catalpae]|uniref:Uncharacterized conserved protein, DUF1697 family n=1 Tax=Paenibacillus catalpae TaxID=1045775 RepID=A0A1I2BMS3_9BACL|nr:DUF1697 domain-containing protein [Paenibacillus catalpae]SFE57482.1 Uncharacterized conserved protein, DUF1697 family [Paenibacillus catalpae]